MNNKDFDISSYMSQAKKYHILSREEETELAKAVQSGDKEAAQKFACHNLRFVVSVAHKYRTYCMGRTGINFGDVVQAGNEGLLMAVQRFDYTRGFKFITYAVWWIKAYIKRHVFYNWSIPRIKPTSARQILFFYQRDIKSLSLIPEHEREKAKEAMALRRKVKVSDIDYMIELLARREIGWDTFFGSQYDDDAADDTKTIANFIPVVSDQENVTLNNEQNRLIKKAMMSLTPKERIVLTGRFFADATLQEIGDSFKINLTRERIRQIELKALKKMKTRLRLMGISKACI